MDLTLDHVLNTTYEELSMNKVKRFNITDLTRASNVARGTIYYYFESIEDIYMATFKKYILNIAIEKSDTFNKFVFNFISQINENKIFSLNVYHLAALNFRKVVLLDIFNGQLTKYKAKYNKNDNYLVSGLCFIVIYWLDHNLELETELIIQEINRYLGLLQITFEQI